MVRRLLGSVRKGWDCGIQCLHLLDVLCRLGSRLFRLYQLCGSVYDRLSVESTRRNLLITFFLSPHDSSIPYIGTVAFRQIPYNLYSYIKMKQHGTSRLWNQKEKREM